MLSDGLSHRNKYCLCCIFTTSVFERLLRGKTDVYSKGVHEAYSMVMEPRQKNWPRRSAMRKLELSDKSPDQSPAESRSDQKCHKWGKTA